MIDIWQQCQSDIQKTSLSGILFRTVENQEQVATMDVVDDLNEQDRYEALLDASKPKVNDDTNGLHYLLSTPFRYPPLPYGSRFGTKEYRGLFYGSLTEHTAFAEDAYYRLVFRYESATLKLRPEKKGQRTLISTKYKTDNGLQLQNTPFDKHQDILCSQTDYSQTQMLGKNMREEGIAAFEFESARDVNKGINIGIFQPSALVGKRPLLQQNILVQLSSTEIKYRNTDTHEIFHFNIEDYLINNELPLPA